MSDQPDQTLERSCPHDHPPSFNTPAVSTLFRRFFRLGITAFGGPAMIGLIREMAVQRERWLDQAEFRQGVAVCQTIPGATAMQVAAYVGLRAAGIRGALAAYIGFGLPACLLMVLLSAFYRHTRDLSLIGSVFAGLQVIVVAMMIHAAIGFGRSNLRDWRDLGLALAVTGFLLAGGNPLLAIIVSGLLGMLLAPPSPPTAELHPYSQTPLNIQSLLAPALLLLALVAALAMLLFIDHQLFELAAMMVRIDLFAFGGGYGSVPLMFNEVVAVKQWMDSQTFMDGIALGQVTPGPIVITATFVGFLQAGWTGALVATVAIFAPSLILLTAAVPTLDRFRNHPAFQQVLHGVVVSFTGLLCSVALRFALSIPWDPLRMLFAATAILALWRKVDTLWLVVVGTAVAALVL